MPTPTSAPAPARPTGSDVRAHLAELGDEVRAASADLPAEEDDVASLLEPRAADPDEVRGYLDELDELADDEELDVPRREHRVTGVLVAHDGDRWLPAVLTALHRSRRRPERVVAVDTGSTDGTADLLAKAQEAGLVDRVVTLGREVGFGAAVAAALATGSGTLEPDTDDVVRWVWLLHDDSAPAPGALDALLLTADIHRSADILGPKLRGWNNQAVLLEAGVTVARSGNRITGLERRELDQGQHDGVRDVLAVSSAGMLVRREVWDAVAGFDPALPLFRDDVDFCWRARLAGFRVVVATDAVVHHREAATHGRRVVSAGSPPHGERPRRLDRSAAVHLMRSHAHGAGRALVTLRMIVGSLLRIVGFLLGKSPEESRDEWGALTDALRDRGGLRSSRRRVEAAGELPGAVPPGDVRALLAPRSAQARHALESVADLVAGRDTADAQRSVLDSTPDDPDGWYADDRRPSRLRRWITRPGTLLVLGLLATTLVGVRALLGEGVLLGGALLPAPDGAGDLWASYLTPWHEVGPGSAADAPAWLVPLTLLAGLLRGSASAAVDVVLLLVVPLAGLTSYLAMRGVVASTWARLWAAAAYATLPAVTGALSGGRIGTAVSVVLLPVLARSCGRLLGLGRPSTWRRAFGTALLLAVVVSFTPVVWILVAVLALLAAFTVARDASGRLRLLAVVLTPVALLVPWSLRVLREPALLWLEPGLIGPSDPTLTALDVLLLRPGGPGSSPIWLGLGLVVAGVVAVAVPGGRRPIVLAWVVGGAALVLGLVERHLLVLPDALAAPITPWPGVPTMIWGGALILCAALTADRLPRLLAGRDFGWRQPSAALLIAALVLAPVASLLFLVAGADGPLRRGERSVIPAFVAAEMRGPDRPRALVLRRPAARTVVYDLLAAPEPQTGDLDVAAPAAVSDQIDTIVALLAAGVGADEVDRLAEHGIRYVVVADSKRRGDSLVEALDGERGLRRLSARDGDALWQVVTVATRAQAVSPPAPVQEGGVPVRSALAIPTTGGDPRTPTALDTALAAGPAGRRLALAEAVDSRWRLRVDGEPVELGPAEVPGVGATDLSAQQAVLPAAAAQVTLEFDGASRRAWLWAQAAIVLVVVVLALPSRRRDDDDDSDELDPETAEPEAPGPETTETETTEPETTEPETTEPETTEPETTEPETTEPDASAASDEEVAR
jgi:GT2 family glycosyltransferase